MSLTIHQSGIDAAINAKASGFDGVTLNRVDLYNGNSKTKSLPLKGVQVIEPSRIYVVAQDNSTDSYDVTKIEFYTSTGARFATAKNADNSVIQSKARNSTLLLAHQLNIATAPGTVAPSGDVSIYAPQATETRLGAAEIATQAETNAGKDDSRYITAKKLWALLTAKFARTDIRPKFKEGINTNGKPIQFGGNAGQFEGITYDDVTDQPGTFHFLADKDDGAAPGNAFLKIGGVTLNSGGKVTGVSDSVSNESSSTLATSKAVRTAHSDGTRQATESQRGQAEIATQAETTRWRRRRAHSNT